MTDAQTEARAIVSTMLADKRLATKYPIETLTNVIVEHIATALAAKDAELAEAWQRYVDANEARIDAEAQLAEANKALEPFALASEYFDAAAAHFSERAKDDVVPRTTFTHGQLRAARRASE